MSGYKIRDQSAIHFITFAVIEWVDVFTRKQYADIVVESLKYCQDKKGLIVYAWCLMSNHIHLIVAAKNANLSDVLRDFKKFTSKQILDTIIENKQESRRNWMLWLFKSAGAKNSNNKEYQFWRQNNQPKELVTNEFMQQKLDYIHNNPVEAGIVENPKDYLYSSARNYAGLYGLIKIEYLE